MNIKGTQKFKAGDKEYTLCMSINAYAELQAHNGMDMQTLFEGMGATDKPDFPLYRQLFMYGLQDYHPEITTPRAAGLIMAQLGMDEALEVLLKAIVDSMPMKPKADPAGGGAGASPVPLEVKAAA